MFSHVFNPKIIHHQGESDRAGHMLEQAGGVADFKVSSGGKSLLEQLVGQLSCLGKAVNAATDFYIDEAALLMLSQVILTDGVFWEHI